MYQLSTSGLLEIKPTLALLQIFCIVWEQITWFHLTSSGPVLLNYLIDCHECYRYANSGHASLGYPPYAWKRLAPVLFRFLHLRHHWCSAMGRYPKTKMFPQANPKRHLPQVSHALLYKLIDQNLNFRHAHSQLIMFLILSVNYSIS